MAEQTYIGEERIRDAQRRSGLSNEAIARKVPVSEKTWRRWKNRGEIPTSALPAVAQALGFELHDGDGRNSADPARLEDLLVRAIDLLEQVVAAQGPPMPAAVPSARRG